MSIKYRFKNASGKFLYVAPFVIVFVLTISFLGRADEKSLPENTAQDADALYLKGCSAYFFGNHEIAANNLIGAARLDWRCLAIYRDPRWQKNPPPASCLNQSGLKKPQTDDGPAAEVLYRLGMMQRKITEDEVKAGRRKDDRYYLARVINEFPGSEWSDNASFAFM